VQLVRSADELGRTALMQAAINGRAAAMEFLLLNDAEAQVGQRLQTAAWDAL
jgi:ankyrin repeat protein